MREDSYYPAVGEPDIDALRYHLDLAWYPDAERLSGVATIWFRALTDARRLQLDLGDPLRLGGVRLDGRRVQASHPGKDLVVDEVDVSAGSRHTLRVAYAGSPEPVAAPTVRADVAGLGWHTTADGGAWTMQEPYGAYTWYPVEDHPSDKAYFDLTITTPDSMRGVSGGALVADEVSDGVRTSSFRLGAPVASYLTTLAIGDYARVEDTGPGGLPLTYWVLPGQQAYLQQLRRSPALLAWLSARLGPYPFPTAGAVLVPSTSGMETQETVTIGAGPDPTTFSTNMLHEYAHQWYGDSVTPRDWSDVWLNEAFATYLQLEWSAAHGAPVNRDWAADPRGYDQSLRDAYGPPGAYDHDAFASANVYYCGALMLRRLGDRVGSAELARLIRSWPQRQAYGSASRAEWIDFVERRSGQPVRAFVREWLLSETTPTS